MEKHKRLAYLLGCYMVIVDREINAPEVEFFEKYLLLEQADVLNIQRQLVFSDSEDTQNLTALLSELGLTNITLLQKQEIVRILVDIVYGDGYMAAQEKQLLDEVVKALNADAEHIIKGAEDCSKERINPLRLSGTEGIIGKVENFTYNLFEGNNNKNTIDFLLGSLSYATLIEKITDTVLIDIERVVRIVKKAKDSLASTNNSLSQPTEIAHDIVEFDDLGTLSPPFKSEIVLQGEVFNVQKNIEKPIVRLSPSCKYFALTDVTYEQTTAKPKKGIAKPTPSPMKAVAVAL